MRKLRWLAIPLALTGAIAVGGIFQVSGGVHFKGLGQDVDFGEPPQRFAFTAWVPQGDFDYVGWRPGTRYIYRDSAKDWEEEAPKESKGLRLAYQRARNAELRGDLGRALSVYRGMAKDGQGDRAYVRGRIDLLEEMKGRNVVGLRAYLAATPGHVWPKAEMPKDGAKELRPFIEYDRVFEKHQLTRLADRSLMAFADRYPRSSKAPAALIMAGRELVEEGRSGYSLDDLRQANEAFRRVLRRYPKSRFVWDARGGLGRIDYLRKRPLAARRHYEWQLANPMQGRRSVALASIAMCDRSRGRKDGMAASYLRLFADPVQTLSIVRPLKDLLASFSATDARRLDRQLRQDPALLQAYVDFRMDFTKATPDLVKLGGRSGLSGPTYARLAQAALALRKPEAVQRFARRALAKRDRNDSHALATFTLASLERRAGRNAQALQAYRSIVRRWPQSYLVGGARENLALLEERRGDLAAALDQYTVLDYEYDFAYLIDARMTTGQLARYIRSRPGHGRRKSMIYTLGMRYLRERKWSEAEATFARLSTSERRGLTRGQHWGDDQGGVQDPLATLQALRSLDQGVRKARRREAKAAALFAMGDYYYRHKYLLLYSEPAWRGMRALVIGNSWNLSAATSRDDRALRRHHEEHETYAQALAIFRRVVGEYPETAVAPKAAYWGGCAADHLAGMAPYWRWRYRSADLVGISVRLMRFAERMKDPELAAKARKYHRVFRSNYTAQQMTLAKDEAEPRYRGGW